MKRRIFAMLLILAMVLSMTVAVSAAETETNAALTLEVSQGKGSVTVAVYLQNCDGVTNGRFSVEYDDSILTLAEVRTTDAYAMSSVNDETPGTVSLAWVGSELTADKTLMVTLVLETGEEITQNMTYTVTTDGIYADTVAVEAAGDQVTITCLGLDTSALEKAIAAAEALDKDAYTAKSYAAVETALKAAKAVLADADATQAEVDAAAAKLVKAINALEKPADEENPETGDDFQIIVWICLIVISLLAMVGLMIALIRSGKAKKGGRYLSMFLAVIMLMTLIPTNAMAVVIGQDQDGTSDVSAELEKLVEERQGQIVDAELEENTVTTLIQTDGFDADLKLDQGMEQLNPNNYAEDEMVRVIIELEGEGLLEQGYTQGQIKAYGSRVSAEADRLEREQDILSAQVERIIADSGLLGVSQTTGVKYNYTVALNGFAMTVPYGTLDEIRALAGVKNAYVVSQYLVPEEVVSTAEPSMYATSETFGSAQTWTELGYTGAGMTIAVIDTGLDVDHPSFAADPEGASMTLEDVQNVLTELNAYALYSETSPLALTAEQLYYSAKVPYGFNYVDCSTDVTHDFDEQGDHGTHVSGIAAANALETTTVVGVAPDAQIVVMKVFGQNGGAYTDDILAAIEDCLLLGVDVINMSLGAQAGFTEDSALVNAVYGRILETDMILAVAAGNSNSSASSNTLGTNVNLTQDPDNGLVNSPATYLAATAVASLENVAMMMPYFSVGDSKIAYVDVTYYDFAEMSAANEGVYEYVVVPGVGDVSDYEGLDVTGKIALVRRGTLNFTDKQRIAYEMGAVALVVYDNVDGDLLSMYDGGYLPNVFISKADGEIMIEAAVDGVGTMVIHPYGVETAITSPAAGQLSDFSCWGVTSDLQLTPDVTAPGGNIFSCYTDGAYGTMSGTSMASPHIAGMSALVLQHLHEVYPDLDDAEYHTIAESLIMCTAVPVYDTEGILYSPRKQGAGAANVYSAVTSPVYLTSYQSATGELTPKASLGDDPDRTGVFTFSFEMHNLTDTEQVYALGGDLLTDQYIAYEGQEYMSETGRNLTGTVTFQALSADLPAQYDANRDGSTNLDDVQFVLDAANGLNAVDAGLLERADLNGDGKLNTVDAQLLYLLLQEGYETLSLITVPAGQTVTVNVTVKLSEEDMAYMDAHYENGIYVDGFVRAYAQSEGAVDLSLPLVGFYGDWHDARVIDNGWYYDAEANDTDDTNDNYYNRYLNVIYANLGAEYGGLGLNPYLKFENDPYTPAHNVLSPNGDGYYDYVPEMYISLMRSAELLDFTWYDAEGNELFYEWYAYARKSYYWSGYGVCMPAIYTDAECEPFTFYDENGELMVEDLQELTLVIRAYLDDGDLDDISYNADGDPVPDTADADDVVEIPVVIDLKAPTIDTSTIEYYTEDGRNYISFQIHDNYDIAAVVVTTAGGGTYEYMPVHTKEEGDEGETATITLDITEFDATFQVVLCDYGCNESYYELANVSSTGLSGDYFYGFRRYSTIETTDTYYTTDQLNGWYSFQTSDQMIMHTSQASSGEATVYAAEYVDGYIFGAQAGENGWNTMFVMKAGSWDRVPLGDEEDYRYELRQTVYEWPGEEGTYFPMQLIVLDMTYDYTTGTMYMLANALENNYFPEGEINILCSVDLETGDVTILGKIFSATEEENTDPSNQFLALTLACDADGTLYTINYETGMLYTINKTPVATTETYGYGTYIATNVDADGQTQYYPAAYTQSMTFDLETGELYWAAYQGKTGTAAFINMDKTTGEVKAMTYTADNAEIVALIKPYDTENTSGIIKEAVLEGIYLDDSALYMSLGQTATMTVLPKPYNAALGQIEWSTDDASVATVSQYGLVEAVGVGSCTVTAVCGSFTAQCQVSVSEVSGTLFAYSGDYWLLMDAGSPDAANQIADAMTLDGEVKAAAYRDGYIYAAALEMTGYDEEDTPIYRTNLYKLDASTLSGELLGFYDGEITALAFNYADGFLYGMTYEDTVDLRNNQVISYGLIRVNMSTADTLDVVTLVSTRSGLAGLKQYTSCSGALAIDYEGNFYISGTGSDGRYSLVRFSLDENDAVQNIVSFADYSKPGASGEAMVWSQRNGGILRAVGDELYWVNTADMENVISISLGGIRGASGTTCALTIPVTNEPDVPVVAPTGMTLGDRYTVPAGETIKIAPTLYPWNASGEFTYEIADTSVATVDENGVITGLLAEHETTLTITEVNSGLSAVTTVVVEKNPGYLYGYFQANLEQAIPLEAWGKIPVSNASNYDFITGMYDLTIYAGAYYNGFVYAVGQHNTDGVYYTLKINPGNFAYEILGTANVMVRDMAFDYTTGTMYAVGYTEVIAGGLYQVDLETMELTLVSDNDLGVRLVTLAADAEGTLVAADESGAVYTIDKGTAKLTGTGLSSSSNQYLQSMTYDYNNGVIFWAKGGYLYQVDLANNSLNTIGYTGCSVSALFSVPVVVPEVPETVEPAGVVLAEKNTVAVNETLAVEAVVLPVSVATVDQTLTWTSSDEGVATVDADGVVTGVSAGEVYITATDSKGHSDTILITVTEEHRYFYGYDELSRSWVSFDLDGKIVNTWADAEGLSPIVAAQYIDGILYAYDADGYFYTVDTETFQRTLLGDGIHGKVVSLEAWDESNDKQVYYVNNIPYQMIDLTYSQQNGETTLYGVMMAYNISLWRDSFSYQIVELDMATGAVKKTVVADSLVDHEMSLRPTNLLYRNGYLYTINGYITGHITRINIETGTVSGENILPEYWGDFNGGRSLLEDPLTGVVYAIRDMRTEYIGAADYTGAKSNSELCTMVLGVAYCEEIATVSNSTGTNVRITGMFIK